MAEMAALDMGDDDMDPAELATLMRMSGGMGGKCAVEGAVTVTPGVIGHGT